MTIKEEKRDLFTMPSDYALAHCISADFKLGAGIAKEFDRRFNCRKRLFGIFERSWIPRWGEEQERNRGGCVPLGIGIPIADEPPFIFNLVTKRNFWDKPTLATIKNALLMMRDQCEVFNIKKLAMPRIGCGLDRQKWSDVKRIIEDVFCDTDIKIVVCVK